MKRTVSNSYFNLLPAVPKQVCNSNKIIVCLILIYQCFYSSPLKAISYNELTSKREESSIRLYIFVCTLCVYSDVYKRVSMNILLLEIVYLSNDPKELSTTKGVKLGNQSDFIKFHPFSINLS